MDRSGRHAATVRAGPRAPRRVYPPPERACTVPGSGRTTGTHIQRGSGARSGRPQVVNLVHGGLTPVLPAERLEELGFAIALHANLPLLASVHGMQTALAALRAIGRPADTGLATWDERQRLVRKGEYEELEQRYADGGAS